MLPKIDLIVGILSASGYDARRNECRATWMSAPYDRQRVLCLFLVGDPNIPAPVWGGDTLWLPCPDDYPSLPQKTRAFCRWALNTFDFGHLFKCDDDTYAVLDRMLKYDHDGSAYTGRDIGGYASGGAGYYLTPQAARIVADQMTAATGAEDLLVGQHLARADIKLVADARFGSWYVKDEQPRQGNELITAHPCAPRGGGPLGFYRMADIHRAYGGIYTIPGKVPASEIAPPVEVISHKLGFGELGLGGDRGFVVGGEGRKVSPPNDGTDWRGYFLISAHAPSQIDVRPTRGAVEVFGFLDMASYSKDGRAQSPVSFVVNEHTLAILTTPTLGTHRTPSIRIDGGRLSTICGNDHTRRYAVWAVRTIDPTPPRIVIPTSDKYGGKDGPLAATLKMLDKYWPNHPSVTVIHYGNPPQVEGVELFAAGRQNMVSWADGLVAYLRSTPAETFYLLLDDYALCAPVQDGNLRFAETTMHNRLDIGCVYLTGMHPNCRESSTISDRLHTYAAWPYAFHLQAALWRRTSLLRILSACPGKNAGDTELAGSAHHNRALHHAEILAGFIDANTGNQSLFLDESSKTNWTLPYHNLVRGGAVDKRHTAYLQEHGMTVILG